MGGRNYTAVSLLHSVALVDLNADVGEWELAPSPGEMRLIRLISSANVACGVHAGNEYSMAATVELASSHGAAVGAHPSLNDRANFGRRERMTSAPAVFELVSRQIDSLARVTAARGIRLCHVKPHGALYNMASRDRTLADAIANAVAAFDRTLVLFGASGSELIFAGQRAALRTASEVFADRAYRANGLLVPRTESDAILDDPDQVSRRVLRMVREQQVVSTEGVVIHVSAETICVHGDTDGAALIAARVRETLDAAGIEVSAPL
jgi:UPF0271 protein